MKSHFKIQRYMSNKNERLTDNNLMFMLMPSFIGIAVCTVCLIGLSFAWFTASVEVAPQKLTAANFALDVSITDDSGEIAQNADSTFSLKADTSYNVTLKPIGTANSGYCIMRNKNLSYFSDTIKKGQSFSFTLIPGSDSDFTFVSAWGLPKDPVDITDSSVFNLSTGKNKEEVNKTNGNKSTPVETSPLQAVPDEPPATEPNPIESKSVESNTVGSDKDIYSTEVPTEPNIEETISQ